MSSKGGEFSGGEEGDSSEGREGDSSGGEEGDALERELRTSSENEEDNALEREDKYTPVKYGSLVRETARPRTTDT